jgi:hypothetical protein
VGLFDLGGESGALGGQEEERARARVEQFQVRPSRWGADSPEREVLLRLRSQGNVAGPLQDFTGSLSASAAGQLYMGLNIPVWVNPDTRAIVAINWEHLQVELEARAAPPPPPPKPAPSPEAPAEPSGIRDTLFGWRRRRRDRS